MFSAFNGDKPITVPFNNRLLPEQVPRITNRARVIYGDWGSVRPREIRGYANRPLERVDYPTEEACWYEFQFFEFQWWWEWIKTFSRAESALGVMLKR